MFLILFTNDNIWVYSKQKVARLLLSRFSFEWLLFWYWDHIKQVAKSFWKRVIGHNFYTYDHHVPCSMNLLTHNGLINKSNGFQTEINHCWIVHLKFLFFQAWMTDVVPTTALSEIKLRLLCHDDIERIKVLCGEWFPIEWVLEPNNHFIWVKYNTNTLSFVCLCFRYPDSWYHDITSNKKFFSLAATYRGGIVGMIVAEIKSRTKVHKEVWL